MSTILALFMSTTILKDTNGIIHSPDPSGSRNNQSTVVYHAKTPLHIILLPLLAQADISTVIRILPYDNAAISVKQITAFRIVVHGHSNSYALEAPYGKKLTTN